MTSISDEPMHKMMLRMPESLRRDIMRYRVVQEIPSATQAIRLLLRRGLDAERDAAKRRASPLPSGSGPEGRALDPRERTP